MDSAGLRYTAFGGSPEPVSEEERGDDEDEK